MIKKTLLNFWLLLLCMIVVGASSAWADGTTGQISFGSGTGYLNVNSASVNGNDSQSNTWTVTTVGTTSFTPNASYSQIGSSKKPATSITFTTTLAGDVKFTAFSAEFGGFSGTAGTITLKVDDTTVGTGSLSGESDVTTSASNSAVGKTLTVTVTGISKGVKAYNISYTYVPATVDLTDDEFSWSTSSYTATIDASNTFPTLTNTKTVDVTYVSTNTSVATIDSSTGAVSLVAAGETTIKAVFAGNSTYNAKTVSYNLDVLASGSVAPPTFSVADGTSIELGSTVTITAPEGCTLKYQLGSGDVEAVAARTKVVTLSTVGDVTLTAWSVKDTKESDPASISLTVTKHPISLSFSSDAVEVVRGESVSAPTLSGNTGSGTVTYSSADEKIATVNNSGVVTGVKAGNTTITATVAETAQYLGGSATFDVNVTKPYHTVTFSVNGNTTSDDFQESAIITFPDNPADINGMTFVGWHTSTYNDASNAPSYVDTESETMGTSDVTYYAVFADETVVESEKLEDAVLSQTLQYDTWTYSGTTDDKNTYRLFGNGAYVQSAAFDLSKLMKVNVYGATFGGGSYNSYTIGDGTNTWKSGTVSNSTISKYEVTDGASLSGTKSLHIYSNSGDGSNTGLRISKIEIFVKGTKVSYENFCTTVSALPLPVITMADVEMTWGDTDKSVAPTATVGEDAYEGEFTFTSSDAENLTVASDGKLTCNVPGTYTVTASIADTEDYQAASTTCTVTVNKKNISLSFANTEIVKMVTDETKSFIETATPDPAAYDGTISYAISGSGSATINTSTAQVTYTASTGVNTITATAPATDKYNGNSASYTLYVKTTPTITVSNQTLAYGETYEPSVTGGDVAITAVPNLITVDGGVITAAVVGTATVTVSTAANDTYVAGKETFTLTVTAPTALSAKPTPSPVTVFYESFNTSTGTGGNDDSWSGSIATSEFGADNTWTTTNAKGAKECAKFGTGSAGGSAITPEINLEEDIIYTLTFKAGAWDGKSEGTSLSLSASNATIKNEANTATVSSVTTSKGSWTSYTLKLIVTDESDPVKITFSTDGGNKRFFLDEVKVFYEQDPTATVTLTKNGYATYCSVNPIDFSSTDGYTAWRVSEISDAGVITFTKITEKIKGGQGVLLYNKNADGENTSNATIKFADGTTEFSSSENLLVGTTAPTYVTQKDGDYYTNFALSSSNSDFRKINKDGMVVPANKAYLPVPNTKIPAAEARLTFVFEDDQTTTIQGVSVRKTAPDTYYNLKGQRVDNPKKGGIYVKNGKKVIFK